MSNIFLLLFLFSMPAFIWSLFKPQTFFSLFQNKLEKKGVRWTLGLMIPVSFILFGMTAPEVKTQNSTPVAQTQRVIQQVVSQQDASAVQVSEENQTNIAPQSELQTQEVAQQTQTVSQSQVLSQPQSVPQAPTQTVTSKPTEKAPVIATPKPTYTPQTSCGENYYKNSDGICVHSPTKDPSVNTSGATAQCRDGSLSFSLHRQGTCSGHGGVSVWY